MANNRVNTLIHSDISDGRYRSKSQRLDDFREWVQSLWTASRSPTNPLVLQLVQPGTIYSPKNSPWRIDYQGCFKLKKGDNFSWINLQVQENGVQRSQV
jgi:hypothetical protein